MSELIKKLPINKITIRLYKLLFTWTDDQN